MLVSRGYSLSKICELLRNEPGLDVWNSSLKNGTREGVEGSSDGILLSPKVWLESGPSRRSEISEPGTDILNKKSFFKSS